MEGAEDVRISLHFIAGWFGTALYHPDLKLRIPATAQAVENVEQTIGGTLPSALRVAYLLADGQRADATHPIFPYGYRWLPLDQVVASWRAKVASYRGDDDPRYGRTWWHPGLVPFAEDGTGDGVHVDIDGRSGGVVGEVLHFVNDQAPHQRTARTHPNWWATNTDGFGHWLRRFANDLAAERYAMDGDVLDHFST